MNGSRGMSLVEVLVAMALIATAALPLATLFSTGYANVDRGGERTAVLMASQQRIEWLRNQPTLQRVPAWSQETLRGEFRGFVRTTVIRDDTPLVGLTQIVVTTEKPAGPSVTLVSLVVD